MTCMNDSPLAGITLHLGDCRAVLAAMPEQSVHCCVTSPPYFGLRDYGHEGQIGLEPTPDAYVAQLVDVFRAVRRVLRDDGTLWLNLGDSYAATTKGSSGVGKNATNKGTHLADRSWQVPPGLKPKDLIGIPWRVAFALQADGWWLRQDIVWHKPNPMPESVTDRCTKAHEYVFLLSKGPRYYFDAKAIAEPALAGAPGNVNTQKGVGDGGADDKHRTRGGLHSYAARQRAGGGEAGTRNRRSVWTVTTKPFKGAHFATFPPDLIEPCVLAGCPEGGTVLDPFSGAGTTGVVALRHGRRYIGAEINPDYLAMSELRIAEAALGGLI